MSLSITPKPTQGDTMSNIEELETALEGTVEIMSLVVILLLTSPIWLRFVNEVSCRLFGRVVVICPYCGMPGVIESNHPKVIR